MVPASAKQRTPSPPPHPGRVPGSGCSRLRLSREGRRRRLLRRGRGISPGRRRSRCRRGILPGFHRDLRSPPGSARNECSETFSARRLPRSQPLGAGSRLTRSLPAPPGAPPLRLFSRLPVHRVGAAREEGEEPGCGGAPRCGSGKLIQELKVHLGWRRGSGGERSWRGSWASSKTLLAQAAFASRRSWEPGKALLPPCSAPPATHWGRGRGGQKGLRGSGRAGGPPSIVCLVGRRDSGEKGPSPGSSAPENNPNWLSGPWAEGP